ncbi:MAG: esterase [Alteromonas sp.]|nr:esterase [Alteromonas sp.]MAY22664.1 esterase [Flavobacteriaceae bacterium]|tara:strand:- start:56108 stop:57262 length:1155 start_codon:yes stop_codon:yes gene_type:complete
MRTLLFLCIGLISSTVLLGQSKIIYEEFPSSKLDETRRLKIQLPRDYDDNVEKSYPIVVVLDANYLFEPVAGNVDYFGYWEDMPEAIVVGIMQGDMRYEDCSYDDTNFMPADKGADFFEFVGLELLPYIDATYRTAKFTILVGHDFTASYINYYLFKDPPLFNGYISLSPDLAPMLDERIPQRIPVLEQKTFYYLATGSDDIKDLKEITESLNTSLQPLKSDNFAYYYDNFDGATHYSLVARAIPSALEKIFSVYRPISKEEFNEKLMKTEEPIHQYLLNKYKTIEDLFGLTNPIRVNDFIATATACEKRKQWESLREIAALAQKQYPDTALGDYYLGRYYEETGDPKRAMRTFQAGFDKEEVDFITVDLMLDRADKIKEDFGY